LNRTQKLDIYLDKWLAGYSAVRSGAALRTRQVTLVSAEIESGPTSEVTFTFSVSPESALRSPNDPRVYYYFNHCWYGSCQNSGRRFEWRPTWMVGTQQAVNSDPVDPTQVDQLCTVNSLIRCSKYWLALPGLGNRIELSMESLPSGSMPRLTKLVFNVTYQWMTPQMTTALN
jgi:hypothetical protein